MKRAVQTTVHGRTRTNEKLVRAELADYFRAQQTVVTQQWLALLRGATDLDHARKLPRKVLIDHLPQIYRELCDWIRSGQRTDPVLEVKDNARHHGKQRWSAGFRLEEVLHELDLLRAVILSSTLTRFRLRHAELSPQIEIALRFSIEQYFSRVNGWSIRQYVAEHESAIAQVLAHLEHG